MVIFIDESGVHKRTGHSTHAIIYIEVNDLDEVNLRVRQVEEKLKISSFHWGEERWQVRNKFLLGIISLDFTAKVAIFENPVHPERMIEYVFAHLIVEKEIKRIYIDGKKPKWYALKLKKILRDRGISVKTLRTVNDESFPGIQLADCLAGLLRRYYDNPQEVDAKKWVNKLKKDRKLIMELSFQAETIEKLLKKAPSKR